MKIALIGASGYVGSALLNEALARGHSVTALASNPAKLPAQKGLTVLQADALDADTLSVQLRGHDAVLSAFSGHAASNVLDYYLKGFNAIVSATKRAVVQRLLVVGGAGSLFVAPGQQLIDTPQFPVQWKATAEGARQALRLLQEEPTLDWTMLSPPALLEPGERSTKFRLGADTLLVAANGESRISLSDYAVAMIDELERPTHPRQRFTVGY